MDVPSLTILRYPRQDTIPPLWAVWPTAAAFTRKLVLKLHERSSLSYANIPSLKATPSSVSVVHCALALADRQPSRRPLRGASICHCDPCKAHLGLSHYGQDNVLELDLNLECWHCARA